VRAEASPAELAVPATIVKHTVDHKGDDPRTAVDDSDKMMAFPTTQEAGIAVPAVLGPPVVEDDLMEKVNLESKFSLFHEHWSPKIIGELNGQQVKIAKIQGEFIWHHHEDEDELFLVVKGELTIKLPDKDVHLHAGEFLIVPRGVKHKPVAERETQILMVEPTGTLNTGNVQSERTVQQVERI
jgi:mannose-6-phosphate isomerase-like protein (cupin superfamily)